MGWCSGTDIFDEFAPVLLTHDSLSTGEKVELLVALIDALENHDWDCQQDSAHWGDPIVQEAMKRLHPKWFTEE